MKLRSSNLSFYDFCIGKYLVKFFPRVVSKGLRAVSKKNSRIIRHFELLFSKPMLPLFLQLPDIERS